MAALYSRFQQIEGACILLKQERCFITYWVGRKTMKLTCDLKNPLFILSYFFSYGSKG